MMNPRELVDHIRSSPETLLLKRPLRFHRRTRSNPCDFIQFLQALQSSETIRTAICYSHCELGIPENEWVLLIKALGSVKCIDKLILRYEAGSRHFCPFQAVADAVNNAHSLREMQICLDGETFPRDSHGLIALASALREHIVLQKFRWFDFSTPLEAVQDVPADFVLQVLPRCPHVRRVTIMSECVSADAMDMYCK